MKKPISLRTVLGLSAIVCLGMTVPSMAKNPSTGCEYKVLGGSWSGNGSAALFHYLEKKELKKDLCIPGVPHF